MQLYIVRHGDAMGTQRDDLRPLSDRGVAEVKTLAAAALTQGKCRPDIILHSPKLRAVQTAEIIAEILQPTNGLEEAEDLMPEDDPHVWPRRLAKMNGAIMLVSHMPFVAALGCVLLKGRGPRPSGFSTAEMHALHRHDDGLWTWQWRLVPGA